MQLPAGVCKGKVGWAVGTQWGAGGGKTQCVVVNVGQGKRITAQDVAKEWESGTASRNVSKSAISSCV